MSDNLMLTDQQVYAKKANGILTMGIISLICATVIFIGPSGLILGIINVGRVKRFIRQTEQTSRKVKIAKILSVASIVFGGFITAYWLFIAVLFIYDFITSVF